MEIDKFRVCSECGKKIKEGYCIEGGHDYYCSDECLYKNISNEEYEELFESGDSYYTEWR